MLTITVITSLTLLYASKLKITMFLIPAINEDRYMSTKYGENGVWRRKVKSEVVIIKVKNKPKWTFFIYRSIECMSATSSRQESLIRHFHTWNMFALFFNRVISICSCPWIVFVSFVSSTAGCAQALSCS